MSSRVWSVFFLAALLLVLPELAHATSVERLVMPGDLIEGHAKYESECSKCHRPFSKESQRSMCLDCHEKVKADIDKKAGFHGLDDRAKKIECRHCHTDHKGRKADVVKLDREIFDHGLTDFPLKGGHTRVKCDKCHKKEKKFRETPHGCIDCHKEDDRHRGQLGKDCAKCHEASSWKAKRKRKEVNHDKTDFPLKGKHKKVSCDKCHPNDRYKKTPKDCYTCHLLNDIHGGKYGKKCKDCHTEKEWKNPEFDHSKTKFDLKDAHEKVKCDKCHKAEYEKKLPKDCYGCHKNNDEHKGRYGKKCEDCHSSIRWSKTKFDHDKTDFKLKEKHKKVKCEKCHVGPAKDEKVDKVCYDCHKKDDSHKGQQGKVCEKCHNERGWRTKVFFDHDITRFPLIGLHAITPCEECHLSSEYKSTERGCLDCHKSDDKHEGKLGPACNDCHNPNGWLLWSFDHDKQTKFKLDGEHKGIECKVCHTKPVKKKVKLSSSCASCHHEDDIHQGRFGMQCDRCHTTESFEDIDFNM